MKRKFECYILAGRGIGLRFVLLISCLVTLCISIFFYARVSSSLSIVHDIFSDIPKVVISNGEIISPMYSNKLYKTRIGHVEFNTNKHYILPETTKTDSFIYITKTQVFIQETSGLIKRICNYHNLDAVRFSNGVLFRAIKIRDFQNQYIDINVLVGKFRSLIGLFFIGFGITVFGLFVLDFFIFYFLALLCKFIFRLKLSAGEVGRLSLATWGLMAVTILILNAFGIVTTFWWLSIFLRYTGPSVVISGNLPPVSIVGQFFPMWWLSIFVLLGCLIIHFIWSAGLSIYKERRNELIRSVEKRK